jgi:hypothetical protein
MCSGECIESIPYDIHGHGKFSRDFDPGFGDPIFDAQCLFEKCHFLGFLGSLKKINFFNFLAQGGSDGFPKAREPRPPRSWPLCLCGMYTSDVIQHRAGLYQCFRQTRVQ